MNPISPTTNMTQAYGMPSGQYAPQPMGQYSPQSIGFNPQQQQPQFGSSQHKDMGNKQECFGIIGGCCAALLAIPTLLIGGLLMLFKRG